MLTLTEFLEARIAEDEAAIERRSAFPHAIHGADEVGAYNPQCPDCLGLPGKRRVLAECKAKRGIIERAQRAGQIEDGLISAAGGYIFDIEDAILCTLAAVYADHPDYNPEWKA